MGRSILMKCSLVVIDEESEDLDGQPGAIANLAIEEPSSEALPVPIPVDGRNDLVSSSSLMTEERIPNQGLGFVFLD